MKRWQYENKEHLHAYRRAYRQRRKREVRNASLRRTFGISNEDNEQLLALGQFKDDAELLGRAANDLDGSLLSPNEVIELRELALVRAGELGTRSV